jgi:hypothetical protein
MNSRACIKPMRFGPFPYFVVEEHLKLKLSRDSLS